MRCLPAVVALIVACQWSSLLTAQLAEEMPPDFRAIILANIKYFPSAMSELHHTNDSYPQEVKIFPGIRRVTNVELSNIQRRTFTNLYGWAWQTCIRTVLCSEPPRRMHGPARPQESFLPNDFCTAPKTIAVFVVDKRVVDSRTALVVDQCDNGNYAPLQIKKPKN